VWQLTSSRGCVHKSCILSKVCKPLRHWARLRVLFSVEIIINSWANHGEVRQALKVLHRLTISFLTNLQNVTYITILPQKTIAFNNDILKIPTNLPRWIFRLLIYSYCIRTEVSVQWYVFIEKWPILCLHSDCFCEHEIGNIGGPWSHSIPTSSGCLPGYSPVSRRLHPHTLPQLLPRRRLIDSLTVRITTLSPSTSVNTSWLVRSKKAQFCYLKMKNRTLNWK
jgi:hypothetical protein